MVFKIAPTSEAEKKIVMLSLKSKKLIWL